MFYSHTFLARKGPLGTVWCAAHVQHRLKKSHYNATHIPSTVERIMYPEVPIALRMSGHLLLGVVRIYSKKIDYLYQDYNVLLIGISKAFDASTDVNLPKDATHAKSDDVTLPSPNKFALDEFDLDEYSQEGFHDNHLKSLEDITLTDQIPVGRDPYIAISVNEDVPRDSTHSGDASGSAPVPMEEDSPPSIPVDATADFHDPGPSNQIGVDERTHEDSIPEFERMRDAVHSDYLVGAPVFPDRENDVLEPDTVLEELMREKDKDTPVVEEMLVSGGKSLQDNQEQPSAPSEQVPDIFNSHVSFGLGSPDLAIRSSPPVEQPKPRRRKRQFDEKTVLTNKFMKKSIEDTRDLMRRRKDWCSSLGFWRLNNKRKQEKIFLEPITTGLCDDLRSIFNEDYISAKHPLVSVEEVHPEPNVARSPSPVNDLDMEIEHPRNFEGLAGSNNIMSELMNSPIRVLSSPARRDDFTPVTENQLEPQSDQVETTFGTGVLPTPDFAASTGSHISEMETPATFLDERIGLKNTSLFDIPELDNSGELTFLEEDDYTPIGLRGTPEADHSSTKQRGTPEVDSLSVRTRAVAQYLKKKSSATPVSGEDLHGDLSLNTILEGKRRKICARMFYETLVLRNFGLIDVNQDESYGDIKLKVTPKLSKEQFSS